MAEGFPRGAMVRFVGPQETHTFKIGREFVVGDVFHDAHPGLVCVEAGPDWGDDGWNPEFFEHKGGPW